MPVTVVTTLGVLPIFVQTLPETPDCQRDQFANPACGRMGKGR